MSTLTQAILIQVLTYFQALYRKGRPSPPKPTDLFADPPTIHTYGRSLQTCIDELPLKMVEEALKPFFDFDKKTLRDLSGTCRIEVQGKDIIVTHPKISKPI